MGKTESKSDALVGLLMSFSQPSRTSSSAAQFTALHSPAVALFILLPAKELTPPFSYSSKLPRLQLLCFDNLLNCLGVGYAPPLPPRSTFAFQASTPRSSSHSRALFCTPAQPICRVFKCFRTLAQKCRGVASRTVLLDTRGTPQSEKPNASSPACRTALYNRNEFTLEELS